MKIAVACDGLMVAKYFVQSTGFMCYTVERGIIVDCKNMPILDQPMESIVQVLSKIGVDTLITDMIEASMADEFCKVGIEVVARAEGEASDVVRAYVTHTLSDTSLPCIVHP